ncbi:MAG: 2-isopropylmalate synthase [Synechococcales cyanobacterium RU_4_20]|nr:2-isopropylmalate synthase [Synechococcales cyanobacterium RU_4_20]
MLKHPSTRYSSFPPIDLPDRTWPSQVLTRPPIWLSTDLRDGNQALAEPMDLGRKLRLFQLLVAIGFKQIEVGFPAASQTEFDFVRHLITADLIPADVTIQVLTPSREHLIRRTFESLQGVSRAIVHVYNATAPNFRRIVFGLDPRGTLELATQAAQLIKDLAVASPATDWYFQYSPEVFTSTELGFAKQICDAVLDVWEPTPAHRAIINLPASVEVSMPNIFADQVEWMHRHLARRESVVLSVHNHNDRGTSTAAAELGQLAGAERVEGCLFGNGERTGNVDLVTLALNLYTQGIDPGLDFSQLDQIAAVAKDCTQLPIHPRHPYVGELVYTAFSGSHQDAIKKGLAVQDSVGVWEVPYLPMDPADVGRTYASVVRVNSQSGKGGIAFLLERDYGLMMPRSLQVEFSQIVQQAMDRRQQQQQQQDPDQQQGQEMGAETLWQLFQQAYLQSAHPLKYVTHESAKSDPASEDQTLTATLLWQGQRVIIQGQGKGPIDAFLNGLNGARLPGLDRPVRVQSFEERSLTSGSEAAAIAYVELALEQALEPSLNQGSSPSCYGVGIHPNIVTASLLAIISAINRALGIAMQRI